MDSTIKVIIVTPEGEEIDRMTITSTETTGYSALKRTTHYGTDEYGRDAKLIPGWYAEGHAWYRGSKGIFRCTTRLA